MRDDELRALEQAWRASKQWPDFVTWARAAARSGRTAGRDLHRALSRVVSGRGRVRHLRRLGHALDLGDHEGKGQQTDRIDRLEYHNDAVSRSQVYRARRALRALGFGFIPLEVAVGAPGDLPALFETLRSVREDRDRVRAIGRLTIAGLLRAGAEREAAECEECARCGHARGTHRVGGIATTCQGHDEARSTADYLASCACAHFLPAAGPCSYCGRPSTFYLQVGNESRAVQFCSEEHARLAGHFGPFGSMLAALEGNFGLASRASTPDEASTHIWVSCSPELLALGVDCSTTERRPDGVTHSHDHRVPHELGIQSLIDIRHREPLGPRASDPAE